MSEENILEQCVICGFIHRDDRSEIRQQKPHIHWAPYPNREPHNGELVIKWSTPTTAKAVDLVVHATACCECVQRPMNWGRYYKARTMLKEKYPQYMRELKEGDHVVRTSYNVSGPEYFDDIQSTKEYFYRLNRLYHLMNRAMIQYDPFLGDIVHGEPPKQSGGGALP